MILFDVVLSSMVNYKCWAFLKLVAIFKCRSFQHGGLVPRMVECKFWAFPTLVDVCECWAFLTGLWDVFPHGQMWVLGMPFWYDYKIGSYMIRYKCWMPLLEWRHLVSYQEILVWDWGPFWCDCRIGSYMIRSKHWMPFSEWRRLVSYQVAQSGTRGHSDAMVGLLPPWSDVSACPFRCGALEHG